MSGKAQVDVRSATTSSPRIHAAGEPVRSVREADLVSNDQKEDSSGPAAAPHPGSFALDPTPSTRSRGTLERMKTADIDKPALPSAHTVIKAIPGLFVLICLANLPITSWTGLLSP